MSFKEKTINEVINPLVDILRKRPGFTYFTLGHFYREIELLKFPFMKDSPSPTYNPGHGRNVYSQQQYETIVDYCISNGLIQIADNPRRNGWYIVRVLPFDDILNSVEVTDKPTKTVCPPIAKNNFTKSEESKKAQAVLDTMRWSMTLDPDINWCIRFIDGHPFLSVNQ